MNKWEDTIRQFYSTLNQNEGFHSVRYLCRSFLEEPHASFWKGKETKEVVRYIEDWLNVPLCRLEFHSKWIEMFNMDNIINYEKLEVDKVKELLSLLKHN